MECAICGLKFEDLAKECVEITVRDPARAIRWNRTFWVCHPCVDDLPEKWKPHLVAPEKP